MSTKLAAGAGRTPKPQAMPGTALTKSLTIALVKTPARDVYTGRVSYEYIAGL